MKKNKGFTLIELLAVLVIIAAILLLIAPQVLSRINNSKESLHETQIEEIKKASRVYMSRINTDRNELTITVGELKKEGLLDKDIKDPKSGEPINDCIQITITKKDEEDNYYYVVNEKVSENQKCSISEKYSLILIGKSEVEVKLNSQYRDAGILLKGDLGNFLDTSDVDVKIYKDGKLFKDNLKFNNFESNINTTEECIYEIYYTYKDDSNNQTSVSRKVYVKEEVDVEYEYTKPMFILSPKGWSTFKNISVNIKEEGKYILRAGMNINSNKGATKCLTAQNIYFDCNLEETKNLLPAIYYKIDKNDLFYTEQNGIVEAIITDGNKKEKNSLTISTVDRTAPTNLNLEVKTSGKQLLLIATATDSESGIYGYQFSLDNGQTWDQILSSGANSKYYDMTPGTEYNVKFRVINNTYDGTTEGKKVIVEDLNAKTLPQAKNIKYVDNAPVITSNGSTGYTNSAILAFSIQDDYGIKSYKVSYGETTNYGKEVNGNLVYCNGKGCNITNLEISGLQTNKTYHYKITAVDTSNQTSTSQDLTFKTQTNTAPKGIACVPNWYCQCINGYYSCRNTTNCESKAPDYNGSRCNVTPTPTPQPTSCTTNWSCSCVNNYKKCTDLANCGYTSKPAEDGRYCGSTYNSSPSTPTQSGPPSVGTLTKTNYTDANGRAIYVYSSGSVGPNVSSSSTYTFGNGTFDQMNNMQGNKQIVVETSPGNFGAPTGQPVANQQTMINSVASTFQNVVNTITNNSSSSSTKTNSNSSSGNKSSSSSGNKSSSSSGNKSSSSSGNKSSSSSGSKTNSGSSSGSKSSGSKSSGSKSSGSKSSSSSGSKSGSSSSGKKGK